MTGYLLSVDELNSGPGAERLNRAALGKLDGHRLEKAERIRPGKARSQSVGAGLLLQLAVQRSGTFASERDSRGLLPDDFEMLTVSELLKRLGPPVPVSYRCGPKGKPDFENGPGHFNLSHSGSLVCGVFAQEEIGVDIQRMNPLKDMHLAERYFSERERETLAACEDREHRERLFYRIWVRKEAYGKLTGEGIAAVTARDNDALAEQVSWQEYELPEGYCMAVCRYRKDLKMRNEVCLE